jgi:hypothetical protein
MLTFGSAAILYLLLMTYIVLGVLREVRPMWFYVLAATLFVSSQLAFFLLNKVVCRVRRSTRHIRYSPI